MFRSAVIFDRQLAEAHLMKWKCICFFPLCRHPVWPDGGSVSSELDMYLLGMYLYALLCRHLLSFDPAVRRTASCEVEMYSPPPCFRLIPTFCYCFYGFFRELDIASGRSPDRNKEDPFHAPTRWAKLYDFAPDIQDAMELRALWPHVIFVKVISVWYGLVSRMIFPSDLAMCGLHEFLRYDVGEGELLFMMTDELDYIGRVWLRTSFARSQQDLRYTRTEYNCHQLHSFRIVYNQPVLYI